jgi:hypothetical protein
MEEEPDKIRDAYFNMQIAIVKHQKKLKLMSDKLVPGTLVKVNAKADSSSYHKTFNGLVGMVLKNYNNELVHPYSRPKPKNCFDVLFGDIVVRSVHVLDLEIVELPDEESI